MSIHGIQGFPQSMGNVRSSLPVSEEMSESPAERTREAGKQSNSKTAKVSNLAFWKGSRVDLKI